MNAKPIDSTRLLRLAVNTLAKYSDAYYNTDKPLVSDAEFDEYYDRVEKAYNKLKKAGEQVDFATTFFSKVRAPVRTSKRSAKLPVVLGSLKKAKNDNPKLLVSLIKKAFLTSQELAQEWRKIYPKGAPALHETITSRVDLVISPKLDGLTFLLHYHKGLLHVAYSGGDGVNGQPKMQHAQALVDAGVIPNKLERKHVYKFADPDIFVIGEIVCNKRAFAKLAASNNRFNNPRNSASGWVNADKPDPDPDLTKAITFLAFDMRTAQGELGVQINPYTLAQEGHAQPSKMHILAMLNKLGFKTYTKSPFCKFISATGLTDNLKAELDGLLTKLDAAPYPLDGVVIEVGNNYLRERMGRKDGTPYFAVAYKTGAESEAAQGGGEQASITKLEYSTSKAGALKPTIHFKPVRIDNSTISKATGNNVSYLVKEGLGKGTKITVVKAGGIIPRVIFNDKKKATPDMIVPTHCSCGAKAVAVKEKGKTLPDYYCSKPAKCTAIKLQVLTASIKATKLTGLGAKNIEKLFDAGYTDVLSLIKAAKNPKTAKKLLEIEGFGKSMLTTLSIGLPQALGAMPMARLMVMSNVFMRPGLALAEASFTAISTKLDVTKPNISSIRVADILGPAKADLFMQKYPEWIKFWTELKAM